MEIKLDSLRGVRVGWALTGSFCTLEDAIAQMEIIAAAGTEILPIMSPYCFSESTRFGTAEDFNSRVEAVCNKEILTTVAEVEPIGPQGLLDILIVAPCTSNTLAKIAHGITDNSVTMALKSHLRGGKPAVLAFATNDALGGAAQNIGTLLARKNIYFVPFRQDDPRNKPRSCIADFTLIPTALAAALAGEQVQPLLV